MAEAYENIYETTDNARGAGLLGNDSLAQGLAPDTKFDVAVTMSTKHLNPVERLREIERREKMARELQEDLNMKEKAQNKLWRKYRGEKDWPLPFWRIAHHNIVEDIPVEHRSRVRRMYFLWVLNAVALVWNFICYIIWSTWPNASDERVALSNGGARVLLSLLYVCAWIPLSWQLWYKRYYNTYSGRLNNGRLSIRYFVSFGIHCLFALIMAIGFETSASAGLLAMIKCLAHNTTLGMVMLVSFVLWCMDALASAWLIKKQHIDYGCQVAGEYIKEQQQAASDKPRVITVARGNLQG